MEMSKDLQRLIAETVAKSIELSMKVHSEALEGLEKKISENLDAFSTRLNNIEGKISVLEKSQDVFKNSVNSIDGYVNNIWKENAQLKKEHETLVKQAKENMKKVEVAQNRLDDLEQYGRKAMIEINGFPRKAEEDPLGLILSLADKLKVDLKQEDVEACHRLSRNENAGIIVEFSSRVKRDEVLASRKSLRNVTLKDFGFDSNGKVYINESLTSKRKALIRELKLVKNSYNFKFIWSRKGIIFIRRDENSRPIRINSLSDLNKLNE